MDGHGGEYGSGVGEQGVCRAGAVVVLTGEGTRTIEQAAPPHVESVRRHFIDLLSPEQIEAFATIGETVVGRLTEGDR
ncbi:hypothetical protein ACGFMO_28830 [Streptomyces niveus]|uniref:hypothetical protein n=1 Tax=Streptomyces niveus TaxID=193462 RepID=UPI0037190D0E